MPPPDDPANFGPAERAIYENAIARAWDYYRELTQPARAQRARNPERYLARRPHVASPSACRKSSANREKRAIEVARYVLPVAAFTTMVHTLSGIVLHRLWRMQAGERHALRSAPGDRRNGRARPRSRSAVFRSLRQRRRWKICPSGSKPPRDGEAFAPRIRRAPRRPHLAPDRLFSPRADARHGRGLSRRSRPDRRRMPRRRSHRPPAQSRAQSLSPRNAERRRARAHDARARSTPISPSPRKSATPPTARTSAIAWFPARAPC